VFRSVQRFRVEIAASAATAFLVVLLIVVLPFPRFAAARARGALPLEGVTQYSIDAAQVDVRTILLWPRPQPKLEPFSGEPIFITGWAVDSALHAPVKSIVAVVDGGTAYTTMPSIVRLDVAAKLGSPAYAPSGFSLTIPPCALAVGPHLIAFRFVASDGHGYYRSADYVHLDVQAAPANPPPELSGLQRC
jgi:hypothetical protein